MKAPKFSCVLMLCLLSYLTLFNPIPNATASSKERAQVFPENNGVRIIVKDIELYFNATNGGEITEYFDLTVDPSRSRNLVNVKWKPFYNLLPLFTSLFYRPPFPGVSVLSTGGDRNAKLWLIRNTSEYVILQSSSRIMSKAGEVFKDTYGNVVYVNSTWIVRVTGLVSVERTFFSLNRATFPSGWRWYPFYLTRNAGFNYNGTFYMFNTTYAYSSIVNEATYRDSFSLFHLLPNDTRRIFGVALPFSDTSIGGDGTHNILVAYKYDELINVDGWRADNYYSKKNNITESGPVYELSSAANVSTHTYHMIMNFTHQTLTEKSILSFADYYANNESLALLMRSSVTANKDSYKPGDYYTFYASGISYCDLTSLWAKFIVRNSLNQVIYEQNYGPGNIAAGQTFNLKLLAGWVQQNSIPDAYTLSFQIRSRGGIVITSSNKVITVARAE